LSEKIRLDKEAIHKYNEKRIVRKDTFIEMPPLSENLPTSKAKLSVTKPDQSNDIVQSVHLIPLRNHKHDGFVNLRSQSKY